MKNGSDPNKQSYSDKLAENSNAPSFLQMSVVDSSKFTSNKVESEANKQSGRKTSFGMFGGFNELPKPVCQEIKGSLFPNRLTLNGNSNDAKSKSDNIFYKPKGSESTLDIKIQDKSSNFENNDLPKAQNYLLVCKEVDLNPNGNSFNKHEKESGLKWDIKEGVKFGVSSAPKIEKSGIEPTSLPTTTNILKSPLFAMPEENNQIKCSKVLSEVPSNKSFLETFKSATNAASNLFSTSAYKKPSIAENAGSFSNLSNSSNTIEAKPTSNEIKKPEIIIYADTSASLTNPFVINQSAATALNPASQTPINISNDETSKDNPFFFKSPGQKRIGTVGTSEQKSGDFNSNVAVEDSNNSLKQSLFQAPSTTPPVTQFNPFSIASQVKTCSNLQGIII